ncbi:hypothetical protein [Streptomyces sp. A5-4]|uniref:hypothetical protein n=1 Tax=Streptomyces sp. A5-4 TaxID=3384771 RepID=UPI003DA9FBAB
MVMPTSSPHLAVLSLLVVLMIAGGLGYLAWQHPGAATPLTLAATAGVGLAGLMLVVLRR